MPLRAGAERQLLELMCRRERGRQREREDARREEHREEVALRDVLAPDDEDRNGLDRVQLVVLEEVRAVQAGEGGVEVRLGERAHVVCAQEVRARVSLTLCGLETIGELEDAPSLKPNGPSCLSCSLVMCLVPHANWANRSASHAGLAVSNLASSGCVMNSASSARKLGAWMHAWCHPVDSSACSMMRAVSAGGGRTRASEVAVGKRLDG